MKTVDIKGKTYRAGKMPTLLQFHVSRRLLPILVTMGISTTQMREVFSKAPTAEQMESMLVPATSIISTMPEEDVNYLIFACLSHVQRKEGDAWAPVVTKANDFMYQDVDMLGMLRLVIEVLQENLAGFLQELGGETESQSS